MLGLRADYESRYRECLVPLAKRLEAHVADAVEGISRVDRVNARAKSVDRFIVKAESLVGGQPKYSDPLNQIQDQVGARVITFYLDDVEVVANRIEEMFRPIEAKLIVPERDSEFGYFGKHYVLLLPLDVIDEADARTPRFFELQIKTLYQHAWSEANHDLGYKPEAERDAATVRKIAFTSAQSWGADLIFNDLFNEILEQAPE